MTDPRSPAAGELARLREENEQLRRAMETRPRIDWARGVLVATYRCTPDEAWDLLVDTSQHSNTKLNAVADALLHAALGHEPPPPVRTALKQARRRRRRRTAAAAAEAAAAEATAPLVDGSVAEAGVAEAAVAEAADADPGAVAEDAGAEDAGAVDAGAETAPAAAALPSQPPTGEPPHRRLSYGALRSPSRPAHRRTDADEPVPHLESPSAAQPG